MLAYKFSLDRNCRIAEWRKILKTKLTVVVDNISNKGILGEWGLSIYVEYSYKKILLDAGASNLFLDNMKSLGIDVSDIDFASLSHAHYDHTNGLPAFLDNNTKAKLFLRESTAVDCYKKVFIFHKYIGIPKNLLMDYSDRIQIVSDDYKVMDGVYLIPHKIENLGEIGRREKMFRKTSNGWRPDDFSHEQSMVLETEKGLLIMNSCSHGGAANIINEVKKTFPDKKVYGIIGGFHLFNKTDEEVRSFAEKVKETGVEYICTGHCTKDRAYEILREELGDMVEQMKVGYQIEI